MKRQMSTPRAKLRPVTGANFRSKSQRKAERKRLVAKVGIRGHVANAVADKRLAAEERMRFYRGLRELKMRRRAIARQFGRLDSMVTGMQREVQQVLDRYPDVDADLVAEALMLIKRARVATGTAADELRAFARRRVYFSEYQEAAA